MKNSAGEGQAKSTYTIKTKILILCAAIVGVSIICALTMNGMPFSGRAPVIQIAVSNKTGTAHYTVFHATTQHQLTEGLMNYTFDNCTHNQASCANMIIGELFSFGSYANVCFWMENTPEPLIQAWLSKNGTVSYIYDGIPYSTNIICANGSAVLELGKNLNIPLHIGDVVKSG